MSIIQPSMITVDLQAVVQTMGSDILMFASAMVAFAVLHHMKVKAGHGKITCKEAMIAADKGGDFAKDMLVSEEATPTIDHKVHQVRHQCAPQLEPCKVRHQSNAQPQQQPDAVKIEQQLDIVKVFSVSEHVALMKKYAAERNIKDTLRTFQLIKQSGSDLTSSMYNIVLQAWIKCGNVWAAEDLMEEVKAAGMADEGSYLIIIKALLMIRDLEKAKGVLQAMGAAGIAPSAAAFDELMRGFARGGLFKEGITLLNEMYDAGVRPSGFTLDTIADLLNSARKVNINCAEMRQTLIKYGLQPKDMLIADPSEIPRLVSVIFQAEFFGRAAAYVHAVEIKGSLAHLDAVRRTLRQHGCWDPLQSANEACSLDYKWAIDQQLDVSIDDGQTSLLSPSMTKTLRDAVQDKAYQTRATAVLACVSKNGMNLPACVENILTPYLGNDLYYLHMYFESQTPRADIFDAISCRHPRVGVRHCWAKANIRSCGQRTLVNGDETDEACFNRHLSALRRA